MGALRLDALLSPALRLLDGVELPRHRRDVVAVTNLAHWLISTQAGTGAVSRLAGYDEGDVPTPCKGMPSACLIFFAGLHDEFPDLPKLFAHVHGSCRNNVVAAALAKKALFYRVEAIDEYASPVASKECLVNSRGVAIDCARAFASATLCELASLNERELELRYAVEVALGSGGKLLE